jgi:hypothetical protein
MFDLAKSGRFQPFWAKGFTDLNTVKFSATQKQ